MKNDDEALELVQQLDPNLETEDVNEWLGVDDNHTVYLLHSDDDVTIEVTKLDLV